MVPIKLDHSDKFPLISKNIKESYQYFIDNYKTYWDFYKFIFETSLSQSDLNVLQELSKPQIECNIGEAYISRLCGENSKHIPNIEVSSAPGFQHNSQLIDFIEGHIRYIIDSSNERDNLSNRVAKDQYTGGYCVMKVGTRYTAENSFVQEVFFDKVFDPTLCGFDPVARRSHKGDGSYCFECFPKTEEEAKEYGIDPSSLTYTRDLGRFNWSYKGRTKKIVMLVDYYEKVKKKVKIVQLSNGMTIRKNEYKKFVEDWDAQGYVEAAPIVINTRKTEIQEIHRYLLCESGILEHEVTPYTMLPLIFVDGNSAFIKNTYEGETKQVTRSYLWNAKGIQKLNNFGLQTFANELEKMIQHNFMAPKEGISSNNYEAWMNAQKPNILLYNAFNNDNPTQPLPQPQVIPRVPIPQEVSQTMGLCADIMQRVLGNFDADLSKANEQQISGVAIQEIISASNSAAMPFIINRMDAWTRAAEFALDMLPKLYPTPSTLPYKDSSGKLGHILINHPDGLNINYNSHELHVSIKAGVDFGIQKARAIQQINSSMQANPTLAEFFATKGLDIYLDNFDFRGIDKLKDKAEEYQQEKEQEKKIAMQQLQQQQNQQNPVIEKLKIENYKLMQQAEQFASQSHLKVAELEQRRLEKEQEYSLEIEKLHNERIKLMATLHSDDDKAKVQLVKAETERYRADVDAAIRHAEHQEKFVNEE